MAISARNVFKGKITALKEGPINAEAEITTAGGDKIVAMLTEASVKSLGLAMGVDAVAVVKTPWVTLLSGTPEYRFSARNQLRGTVSGFVRIDLVLPFTGSLQERFISRHVIHGQRTVSDGELKALNGSADESGLNT